MLPSEKAELWVRRIGIAILILMALYIAIWGFRFISGRFRKAMEQREFPAEARQLDSSLVLSPLSVYGGGGQGVGFS